MSEKPNNVPGSLKTGGDAYIGGDVYTGGGEFIGRDKIVAASGAGARGLIQIIETYKERELSKVEIAEQAEAREHQALANSVAAYIARLGRQSEAAELVPTQANPYKALVEYDLQDASLFFGRTSAIHQLLSHVTRDQLTILHSESGAGKTSLLKAGLMPQLLAVGHVPLYLRPYRTPVHEAVKAAWLPPREDLPLLASVETVDFLRQVTDMLSDQRIVVIVDQFEEIFTVQDPQARMDFVRQLAPCLADDLLPVRWIFAVRGEWLSQLGTFRPEIRNPFANELLLRTLSREEAREVILEPTMACGVSYETALVEQLLDDLGAEGISPPQLQLVCSALFEALDGQQEITQGMYAAAGEARGILRGHLERVLQRDLPGDQRRAARRLLEALVTSEKRRALRHRDELAAELAPSGITGSILEQVLTQLVDSRLLRVVEGGEGVEVRSYELSHDYLLDEIELDPEVQSRKAAQELLEQKLLYFTRDGLLLSGDELAIIAPHRQTLVLSEQGQALIRESRSAVNRRRRLTLTAAIGALVIILGTILTAGVLQSKAAVERANLQGTAAAEQAVIAATARAASTQAVAEANSRATQQWIAEDQSRIALSRLLAGQSRNALNSQADLALLLSIEAVKRNGSPETRGSLYQALSHSAYLIGNINRYISPNGLAFDSEARLIAVGGSITGYNTKYLEQAFEFQDERYKNLDTAAITKDRTILATQSLSDNSILLWDLTTGEVFGQPLKGHHETIFALAISDDGHWLASSSKDRVIFLWDLTAPDPVPVPLTRPLNETNDFVKVLAFDPSGQLLASGAHTHHQIVLWEVPSGRQIHSLDTDIGGVDTLIFTPDGSTLVSGLDKEYISLWDTETWEKFEVLEGGHHGPIYSLAVSPDGRLLASGGEDNGVALWDLVEMELIGEPFTAHNGNVRSLAFDPKSEVLASGSSDQKILLWKTSAALPIETSIVPFPGDLVTDWIKDKGTLQDSWGTIADVWALVGMEAMSPGGELKAVWHHTNQDLVRVWENQNNPALIQEIFIGDTDLSALAFTRDHRHLIVADYGNITLYDVQSGEQVGPTMSTSFHAARSTAINPDNTILAIGGYDGYILLFDLINQEVIGQPMIEHEDMVDSLVFSPDGKTLASKACGAENEQGWCTGSAIILWDVETQQNYSDPILLSDPNIDHLLFSPDGQFLVAAKTGGLVSKVLDLNTDHLMATACQIANRNLTQAEWVQYFQDEPYRRTCEAVPEVQ